VDFSYLDGVICQEVVPDVLLAFRSDKEPQDFTVIVQKLLLRGNFTSSELLLKELDHLLVLLDRDWLLALSKCVSWDRKGWRLWASNVIKEFTSVLIAIVNSNLAST